MAAWMQGPGHRLAVAALHGDASFGNVIVLDGQMVLTDFETSGVGPAAYDLCAVRVLAKRFGLPGEFADQLTAASGIVIDGQDHAMLDRLYELVGIAAVVAPHVRAPGFLGELRTRVESLDDDCTSWTAHRRLLDKCSLEGGDTDASLKSHRSLFFRTLRRRRAVRALLRQYDGYSSSRTIYRCQAAGLEPA